MLENQSMKYCGFDVRHVVGSSAFDPHPRQSLNPLGGVFIWIGEKENS